MARAEGDTRTFTEKAGRVALIFGLAMVAYAFIGAYADIPGPNEEIGVAGAGVAAGGLIFEYLGKKKQ